MTKKFKYLIALAAILSPCFGATVTTAYIPGLDDGTVRRDTVNIGGVAGDFAGYSVPGATVKTLYINLVRSEAGIANANPTGITSFPSTIKDIWITGNALSLNTVIGAAARALPTPSDNTTIHFALTTAPAAAVTWFQAALPSKCKIIIEKDSADPLLTNFLNTSFDSLTVGSPITLPGAITIRAKVSRLSTLSESDALTRALITMAGATTFSKATKGISLAGAFAATFSDSSELVDPAAAVTGYTIAAGKELKLIGSNASARFPISTSITRGAGSKFTVIDR